MPLHQQPGHRRFRADTEGPEQTAFQFPSCAYAQMPFRIHAQTGAAVLVLGGQAALSNRCVKGFWGDCVGNTCFVLLILQEP